MSETLELQAEKPQLSWTDRWSSLLFSIPGMLLLAGSIGPWISIDGVLYVLGVDPGWGWLTMGFGVLASVTGAARLGGQTWAGPSRALSAALGAAGAVSLLAVLLIAVGHRESLAEDKRQAAHYLGVRTANGVLVTHARPDIGAYAVLAGGILAMVGAIADDRVWRKPEDD